MTQRPGIISSGLLFVLICAAIAAPILWVPAVAWLLVKYLRSRRSSGDTILDRHEAVKKHLA